MSQRWVDLALWERVLNSSKAWKGFIELGTGNGTFSTFLLLQCIQRRIIFHTFDHRFAFRGDAAQFMKLKDHFHQGDIFKEGRTVITELIGIPEMHPLILFCDNGWKREEFRVFAPLLQNGDLVAVHDWEAEFWDEFLLPMEGRLIPLLFKECEEWEGITRFWKVGPE